MRFSIGWFGCFPGKSVIFWVSLLSVGWEILSGFSEEVNRFSGSKNRFNRNPSWKTTSENQKIVMYFNYFKAIYCTLWIELRVECVSYWHCSVAGNKQPCQPTGKTSEISHKNSTFFTQFKENSKYFSGSQSLRNLDI